MSTTTIQLERFARSRDPETSWSAAMIADGKWTALLGDVYEIIRTIGPATHDEIVAAYAERDDLPPVTPQRIRTAVRSLVLGGASDFGRVRQFPPAVRRAETVGRTRFGRASQMWEVIAR